eukprot:3988369-Amphidinium_carterae.2
MFGFSTACLGLSFIGQPIAPEELCMTGRLCVSLWTGVLRTIHIHAGLHLHWSLIIITHPCSVGSRGLCLRLDLPGINLIGVGSCAP